VLFAAVILILVLIAVVVVLLSRWCRRKRRHQRLRHPADSCAVAMADDGAFEPCIVDDTAMQKLSCSGTAQTRENGLCQVQ